MDDRGFARFAAPRAGRLSRRAALRAGLAGGVAAVGPAAVRARQGTPAASPVAERGAGPVAVKVLTVAMYQDLTRLADPQGGEASRWVSGDGLTDQIAVPGSYSPVYCDAAREHCLVVTGMGPTNAAATMMAVGLSEQFDLSRAYILVAGIAGVTPVAGTLGTAAWAEWVVDGSAANLIDPRELPSDWLYPFFHLGCGEPWCTDGFTTGTEVFHLDPGMTAAAHALSKDVALADSDAARTYRANFSAAPAIAAPRVVRGDCVATAFLWGGQILSDYMAWWVRQWTGGKGTYVMSSAEDIGTLTSLKRLADAGRVDWRRVMVLRTGSDFDQPYPGQGALAALEASGQNGLPIAYDIALENAYRVGSAVSRRILTGWDQWQGGPPAA